jgi:hypothetical protein
MRDVELLHSEPDQVARLPAEQTSVVLCLRVVVRGAHTTVNNESRYYP